MVYKKKEKSVPQYSSVPFYPRCGVLVFGHSSGLFPRGDSKERQIATKQAIAVTNLTEPCNPILMHLLWGIRSRLNIVDHS